MLHDIGLGKGFINNTSKAQATKAKIGIEFRVGILGELQVRSGWQEGLKIEFTMVEIEDMEVK